jgi:hypothetical protein
MLKGKSRKTNGKKCGRAAIGRSKKGLSSEREKI